MSTGKFLDSTCLSYFVGLLNKLLVAWRIILSVNVSVSSIPISTTYKSGQPADIAPTSCRQKTTDKPDFVFLPGR